MKNITRIILSIFFVFSFTLPVFAQKIDTDKIDFNVVKFTATKNTVTYNYILDYANMLYKKINTTIPFKENWGLEYRYKLHTDGTISDLKPMPLNTPYKGKPINKLFEEFLVAVNFTTLKSILSVSIFCANTGNAKLKTKNIDKMILVIFFIVCILA